MASGNPGQPREREPNQPKSVYLAGAWASKDSLKAVRERVNAIPGFKVISTWLDEPDAPKSWGSLSRDDADAVAVRDLEQVGEAEVFILDTLLPSTGGGYDVELGVALSTGAVTYRVGPIRNGFHGLTMHEVPDWESLYLRLRRW